MMYRKAFHYETQRPYPLFKPVRPAQSLSADILISPFDILHAVNVPHRSLGGKSAKS